MKSNIKPPKVKEVPYNRSSIDTLRDKLANDSEATLLLEYPTVYIVHSHSGKDKYDVYVGETNDIKRRSIQHLDDDPRLRLDWKQFRDEKDAQMIMIGHEHFNKSLTLDIENQLMLYMSGLTQVSHLNNRRDNPQNKYYTSKEKNEIFSKIWRKLNSLNHKLFPIEEVVKNSALFKASPFHDLTDNQQTAKDQILHRVTEILDNGRTGQLILVEGEAGSGKTVLLSTIFYLLSQFESEDGKKIDAHLLVNHDEQLKVYEEIAKKLGLGSNTVDKPTPFINKRSTAEKVDVALVDEAHLLWTQGKQSYRGSNQLADIRKRAKVTVAVFDRHQVLRTQEFIEQQDMDLMEANARKGGNFIRLRDQLRMNANPATVQWIEDLTEKRVVGKIPDDDHYDLRIFDDPQKMYAVIKEKARHSENGLSRMLATFDWKFVGNGKGDHGHPWEVTASSASHLHDLTLPWNLQLPLDASQKGQGKNLAWAEQKQTIYEVGSTYTIQGFDLNYTGLIIGPSVKYRDGKIVFDPSASANTNAVQNRTLKSGDKQKVYEELLPNELHVLLTRGVNGLYIYAVDEGLRNALINFTH